MTDDTRSKISFTLNSAGAPPPRKPAATPKLSEAERKRIAREKELQDSLNDTEAYFGAAPETSERRDQRDYRGRGGAPPSGPRGYDSRSGRTRPAYDYDDDFADAPLSIAEMKRRKNEALLKLDTERELRQYDDGFEERLLGAKRDQQGHPSAKTGPFNDGSVKPRGKIPNAFDAFNRSDDEPMEDAEMLDERQPRETAICRGLPPSTTVDDIKKLFPSTITIDNVQILPYGRPSTTDRRSLQAIVWFGRNELKTNIENTIKQLKDKYLGQGFELEIYTSLSSKVIKEKMSEKTRDQYIPSLKTELMPFNAKKRTAATAFGNVAPTGVSDTPKESYEVQVQTPTDLNVIRDMNSVIEGILEAGPLAPMVEHALTTRPEVQADKRFSWLFDGRSDLGKYYRSRMWDVSAKVEESRPRNILPDDDGGAELFRYRFNGSYWRLPGKLKFEKVLDLPDIVADSDYTSDDDNAEIETSGPYYDRAGLDPERLAKLTWMIEAIAPPSEPLIGEEIDVKYSEIAPITAFAMRHARTGLCQIAEHLVCNVTEPFYLASQKNAEARKAGIQAALSRRQWEDAVDEEENAEPEEQIQGHSTSELGDADSPNKSGLGEENSTTLPSDYASDAPANDSADDENGMANQTENKGTADPYLKRIQDANAHIVGLILISDILSNAKEYGALTHRYRDAFREEFQAAGTFRRLSTIDKELKMGAYNRSKWRGSVNDILKYWQEENLLPHAKEFQAEFEKPVVEARKEREEQDRLRREHQAQEAAAAGHQSANNDEPKQKKLKTRTVIEYNEDGTQHETIELVDTSDVESKPAQKPGSEAAANKKKRPRAVDSVNVTIDGEVIEVGETDFDNPLYDRDVDYHLMSRGDAKILYYYLNDTNARPEAEKGPAGGETMEMD